MNDLNLDVTAEHASALHRVVRAMHDGHCPKCGYLSPSEQFEVWRSNAHRTGDHRCPQCTFEITKREADAALAAFQPYLTKSVEVFEEWRTPVDTKLTAHTT